MSESAIKSSKFRANLSKSVGEVEVVHRYSNTHLETAEDCVT